MTLSDEEDELLANFLESELSDENPNPGQLKNNNDRSLPRRIESETSSKISLELFPHILKFLSSEDLVSCSLVCSFLNFAASDEFLWRRLEMEWNLSDGKFIYTSFLSLLYVWVGLYVCIVSDRGLLPPTKIRECPWNKLYGQRDEEDMVELVRSCPSEFKEYYIQMQAAKRSQAPLPSQVKDDSIFLDKTVSDQVSMWKSSRGLTVCDDTYQEVVLDPNNELLVCTISGHCFDRLLSPSEMELDPEQQQGGGTDEAEPFMGSGRFGNENYLNLSIFHGFPDFIVCLSDFYDSVAARAYLLGYNCEDEKELEAALRFC
ncbi:hypothetical protein REPUB_Repub03eG0246300 [Reevesia pubescens]